MTRAVYVVEDAFETAARALDVVAGDRRDRGRRLSATSSPRTLGVGYDNIDAHPLGHERSPAASRSLSLMKFVSWAIALGSGTSGGTLAPLFTIGGGLGAVLGAASPCLCPHAGIDVRMAALVGMAAIFAGASRAMLASVVFAFETTLQPLGLLPLLGGCTASFLVSCLLMRNTIMTEKIARRGVRVPAEYHADYLDQVLVRDVATKEVIALFADQTIEEVRGWINSGAGGTRHQGFPILNRDTNLIAGVLTRRDLLAPDKQDDTKIGELIHSFPRIVMRI